VLHPGTVAPAIEGGIPVRVRSSRRPERQGTLILAEARANGHPVKSIASKLGLVVLDISIEGNGGARDRFERIFRVFDRHGVSPELVATSQNSLAVAVSAEDAGSELVTELAELGTVAVKDRQAAVAVVGDRLREAPGIVAEVFSSLDDLRVSLVSMGGSELSLGFLVDEPELAGVVRRLHRRLIEDHYRSALHHAELRPAAMMA
jgi:aspartate kinase